MNEGELQFLDVEAQGPQRKIAFRFLPPKDASPVFVWFCGFKSEMGSVKAEALAAWAAERGAGCLRFDYSGHGLSSGPFEEGTIGAWLAEAEAVCEAAGGGRKVFVGSSMGGWLALLLAKRLLPRGGGPTAIALIAPAWDMTRLMWERIGEGGRAEIAERGVFQRPSAYDADPYPITGKLIEEGKRHLFGNGPIEVTCPVRILHGQLDPDVPWRHSLGLVEALASEDVRLALIKDAEHRLSRPQDLALLFTTLAEFIE